MLVEFNVVAVADRAQWLELVLTLLPAREGAEGKAQGGEAEVEEAVAPARPFMLRWGASGNGGCWVL